jgi:tRNA (guanine-N7-)-methyltransferase
MARGRQIGRLKLNPLTPEVRQRYLLDWDAVELRRAANTFPPLTSLALFGNQHPLEVEIGAGSGEYLCYLAARSPQANFLGIEVSRRAAYIAVAAAADPVLGNLRILRADFKLLVAVLAPQSWQAVYLHFPDPPHNREDAKHAIFDHAFLDAMAVVLVPGGQLSVVSDKTDFFTRMLALAAGDARFAKIHAEPYLQGFEPEVKSRFQLSWERKGIAPRRFVLRRN